MGMKKAKGKYLKKQSDPKAFWESSHKWFKRKTDKHLRLRDASAPAAWEGTHIPWMKEDCGRCKGHGVLDDSWLDDGTCPDCNGEEGFKILPKKKEEGLEWKCPCTAKNAWDPNNARGTCYKCPEHVNVMSAKIWTHRWPKDIISYF